MATKATPVDASEKGKPGVQEVIAQVPGVGPITTYFRVELVDDLTGKPEDGMETITLRFPHEVEQEVEAKDDEGNPIPNGDGTNKIVMEKFIAYETKDLELGDASRTKLFKALEPYRKNARKTAAPAPAPIRSRTASGGASAAVQEFNRKVKEWARLAGHEVADRGRVPAHLKEAFLRSHPDEKEPTA